MRKIFLLLLYVIALSDNGRFTETSVQKWRAAMARQRAGGAPAKIFNIGSSTTYGLSNPDPLEQNNYTYRVQKQIEKDGILGNIYEGEIWLTKYQPFAGGATSIDSRFTIGSGWQKDNNSFGVGGYALGNNTDNSALVFSPMVYCTGFTIVYITNPSFSKFTWQVDSGYTNVVDASTSTGTAVLTISGLPYATHSVTIRLVVNGTKRVIISNFRIDDSNRPAGGIHITHAGINGSMTAQWCFNNGHVGTSLPLAFTRTAPDLTCIQLGVNDAVNGVPISTFYNNYKAIVTYAKSAGSDVVIIIPHPPNPYFTNLSTWQQNVDVMYQIANETDCSVIDMQQRMPSYSVGSVAPFSYYADDIHLNAKGTYELSNAVYNFIKKIN
jgi:lysophospholipase L1-like esterase